VGCTLLAASDELISSAHPVDAPIPHSVHVDEPVPAVSGPHPRLIFSDAEIPAMKAAIAADPQLSLKFDELKKEGDRALSEPPAVYIRDTEKSLIQSRLVLSRVSTLAGLYRLTGERRYADRAKQEMLAAAAFKDWRPIDFLPTAELLNAMGLGYDWLYSYLTPDERSTILHAILEQGLQPAQHGYKFQEDWTYTTSNHNIVGNGGVAVAAIAVADDEPKLAKELIDKTRHALPPAMDEYAPDGAWPEGPIYWDYATRYATYYLSALDSGLGTDFGTSTYPGFRKTGMFRIYSTGPTKKTFNFGDAEEQIHPAPFMFYFARRFKLPIYAAHENYVSTGESNIFELIWRSRLGPIPSFESLAEQALPLDAYFRGVDVAFLRGSWSDPNATWVGFKAGTNKGSHRHLDLGSFVMDALGERWALDLGPDDYGLPGYNGTDKRWTYYRCSTEGHNTLTIDGANQSFDADAQLIAFHTGSDRSYAVVDTTGAYPHAHRVLRGIEMLGRRDLLVVDEVEMSDPSQITWNFHTKANISLDGDGAVLEMGGKKLRARILAPEGARFEIANANPPAPQKQEPNVKNLQVQLRDRSSRTRIIVLLSPELTPPSERILRSVDQPIKVDPLKSWIEQGPIGGGR
jgi:hypothetical protein